MSAFDYGKLRDGVTWQAARKELGYKDGDPINLAEISVDRNIDQGRGEKLALIHEDAGREVRISRTVISSS